MVREAWWAAVHGSAESDVAKGAHVHRRYSSKREPACKLRFCLVMMCGSWFTSCNTSQVLT